VVFGASRRVGFASLMASMRCISLHDKARRAWPIIVGHLIVHQLNFRLLNSSDIYISVVYVLQCIVQLAKIVVEVS